MPNNINHWWTSRPKRKLITLVDELRVFLAIAEGKQWRGNRVLHREFEDALEEKDLKGIGGRRDAQGSGGRTHAAWLMSFGLWFEDSSNLVRSTFAGEDLIKGVPPVPIITEQLLNFQHPSPSSRNSRVNLRFKIFPFRFILNLLLQPKLNGVLSKGELARFVITNAETEKDLNSVVDAIISYRNSNYDDSGFDDSFVGTYGNLSKLEDTANTFINQLEYTQLIGRIDGESKLFILDSKKQEVIKILNKPNSLITRIDGEYEFFQRKYGLGPHHKRDDRKFSIASNLSYDQFEQTKVLLTLSKIIANQPITSINNEILNKISEKTGINKRSVEKIIASAEIQPSYDSFEEKYLQLSVGDKAFATEFEKATEGIFGKEGLGFDTKWIGSKGINPDILAISNESGNEFLGILDTKASNKYSIGSNNRRAMIHDYIPMYKNYKYDGIDFELEFFSFIAGGFKSTIDKGINSIYQETAVKGSAITARELLHLLRKHRASPFSMKEFKRIFTLNKQVLPTDFD